ncbi:hypothetical protein O181_027412 [Austropuccinia psidii MF-1]|uniref:Integrase catalytic domain-containing protein n=1 Tax=Austropuccinia psidii MF-1 TaxID=1389203 RepID=A0A9Q3CSK5_9BASI|nr:hypothetical protein [Austropuccinia psidii MF-1]
MKTEVFSYLIDQIQKAVLQDKDYKEILKKLEKGESASDHSLEPQPKLLLIKDRVVIPSNHEHQLDILQKRHDSLFDGHPGQEKTLNIIKRDSSWAGMNQIIKDYVSSCQKCSRKKNIHHKKFGLLKPLQIPSAVDKFSKMAIFIPAYSTINALYLAQIFISHVFSKNGLPISIFSDRGSSFVSSFWNQLCQKLKKSRDLSTAFHPETDEQKERVNQILEQYPWIYPPFFSIYQRNPSFDSIHIPQDTPAGNLSTKLQSVEQVVKEEMESAIKHFKKCADRNRAISPDFQTGEKVWLASKNIKTARPTKKLSERWLGPFEVLKQIGSHAYQLKLPQKWKSVHPVFHVSLLKPVNQSTIPNQHQLPPPPLIVEKQEEWEVAQVLDSKPKRGILWYLVEWKVFN